MVLNTLKAPNRPHGDGSISVQAIDERLAAASSELAGIDARRPALALAVLSGSGNPDALVALDARRAVLARQIEDLRAARVEAERIQTESQKQAAAQRRRDLQEQFQRRLDDRQSAYAAIETTLAGLAAALRDVPALAAELDRLAVELGGMPVVPMSQGTWLTIANRVGFVLAQTGLRDVVVPSYGKGAQPLV